MANPPLVTGPDNVDRQELIFSTTMSSRFFQGTMDADTVDMEVSIRGGGFTNDPDLIVFEGTSWSLPNSAAFPSGLSLVAGVNRIQVRSIASNGSVSQPAAIEIRVVREGDVGIVAEPPTDVELEQYDNEVEVRVRGVDNATFQGFNFYASQFAGGGVTGYQRINLETVIDSSTVEERKELDSQEQIFDVATDIMGDPAADPLFLRIAQTQVDEDDNLLQTDFSQTTLIPETVTQVVTSYIVSDLDTFEQYSFRHSRTAGPTSTPPTVSIGSFAALTASDPLYYVVTAVYYDASSRTEIESSFSPEIVGRPLRVTVSVGNFPVVTRQQLVRDYIAAIFRSNPQIKTEPGSVLRDTVIDPFANEAERVRFITDFLHRAQSFASLLPVDDPQNTGTSLAVSSSTYKQALKRAFNLTRDTDVQAVIDRAFEQIASNVGVARLPGRFSRGEVVFFTTTRPTRTITIPLGTLVSAGSVQFRTTRAAEIPLNNIASFRDPTSGRYFIEVPVQAVQAGTSGNVGAGQVRRIVSTIAGLSVTNESAMFGGTSTETNKQLAERAQRAIAAVDTGTAQGYLQTAAGVPGVVQARVVAAGDELMQRDFDLTQLEHRGGKVDIWVQGDNVASVTDSFAFSFDVADNIQFELLDLTNLEFRAVDPELSEAKPIVEMLDFPDAGFEFRNASSGEVFDLTDVTITSFNTIQLSTDVVQPAVTLTDVVLGDYRRRTTNQFVLPRQPVREISSVVGQVSGTLPATSFDLVRAASPLADGRSSLAGDYLTITGTTDTDGNPIPSGDFISVTEETHVLLGEFNEPLDNLGVNTLTIVVTDTAGLVTYRGPNDPSGISDYTIVPGSETEAASIRRVSGSAISSGQTVLVSYEHDENFVVTYDTNLTVSTVQDEVDEQRHVTADVLVKDAVPVPVDISATVILQRGVVQSTVDQALRTNLANLFESFRLGVPVRQGDIISTLDNTTGVAYPVVPLTKMIRQDGALVVREFLVTTQASDITFISAYSSSTIAAWLIRDELNSATSDNGGPANEFRAIFEDSVQMTLSTLPVVTTGLVDGVSYIIGSSGAVIPGFTDDSTLDAAGFTTSDEKEAQRRALTANRVLVTTEIGDSPTNHTYAVTYVAADEVTAKNINTSDAEYLVLGEVEFTFDEDQQ